MQSAASVRAWSKAVERTTTESFHLRRKRLLLCGCVNRYASLRHPQRRAEFMIMTAQLRKLRKDPSFYTRM
jgi:hypothetical protein